MKISPEALKYVYAAILNASESYAGYAALLCIVIAVCFYFISIRKDGFSRSNLAAYVFTLLFFGALSYAAFSGLKSVKQIFYAGYDDGGPFNVGFFSKASNDVWEDAALQTVTLAAAAAGTSSRQSLYDFCYLLDSNSARTDRWILLRLPSRLPCSAPPDTVSLNDAIKIEIDLTNRRISYIKEDGSRVFLYQIIAIL